MKLFVLVIVGACPSSSSENHEVFADNVSTRSVSSKSSNSSVSGRDSITSDTPLSSTPGSPRPGGSGLSRRQKKNRKRDKEAKKKSSSTSTSSPALSRTNSDDKCGVGVVNTSSVLPPSSQQLPRSKKKSVTCKQYDKLAMPDHSIYNYLQSYLLSSDQLRQLGFPQESSLHPGKAYIYKDPEFCQIQSETSFNDLDDGESCDSRLDVNATPFIPSDRLLDSDSDSSGANRTPERKSSSGDISISLNATAKEFIPTKLTNSNSCPVISSSNSAIRVNTQNGQSKESSSRSESKTRAAVERVCVRCSKPFLMYRDGEYLDQQPRQCQYHWGKLRTKASLYTCCQAREGSRAGCVVANTHVWSGLPRASGIIGPLQGYVKTKHRKSYPTNGNFGVYGIDCEMCYTKSGLELAKVIHDYLYFSQ